jgi:hypothetical protein
MIALRGRAALLAAKIVLQRAMREHKRKVSGMCMQLENKRAKFEEAKRLLEFQKALQSPLQRFFSFNNPIFDIEESYLVSFFAEQRLKKQEALVGNIDKTVQQIDFCLETESSMTLGREMSSLLSEYIQAKNDDEEE